MKDHIVNKKELRKRLEAKGWPDQLGRRDAPTLNGIVDAIDGYNKGLTNRRTHYTLVCHNGEDHYTETVLIPYIEPAVVQNLMANYTILDAVVTDYEMRYNKPNIDVDLQRTKMQAIKDMLEEGIDTTPFDI